MKDAVNDGRIEACGAPPVTAQSFLVSWCILHVAAEQLHTDTNATPCLCVSSVTSTPTCTGRPAPKRAGASSSSFTPSFLTEQPWVILLLLPPSSCFLILWLHVDLLKFCVFCLSQNLKVPLPELIAAELGKNRRLAAHRWRFYRVVCFSKCVRLIRCLHPQTSL